jgi:hypothetical protein
MDAPDLPRVEENLLHTRPSAVKFFYAAASPPLRMQVPAQLDIRLAFV